MRPFLHRLLVNTLYGLVFLTPGAAANQSIFLDIESDERQILRVYDVSSAGNVTLLYNDEIVVSREVTSENTAGVFFVVERKSRGKYEIKISPLVSTAFNAKANLDIVEMPVGLSGPDAATMLVNFGNSLRISRLNSDRLDNFATERMVTYLEEIDHGLVARLHLPSFALESLYDIERYEELRALDSQFPYELESRNYSVQVLVWHRKWAVARSYSAQRNGAQALPLYETLVDELDRQNHLTAFWKKKRERIRGGLATGYLVGGHFQKQPDLIQKGFKQLNMAMSRAKEMKAGDLEAYLLNIYGFYYMIAGQLERGARYFQLAVDKHYEISVSARTIDPLTNLYSAYQRLGRTQEAIEVLQRAVTIERQFSAPYQTAVLKLALAEMYLDLGRADDARILGEEANVFFKSINDLAGEARSLEAIAVAYFLGSRYQKANELFEKSRNIFIGNSETTYVSQVEATNLGFLQVRSLLAIGQIESANKLISTLPEQKQWNRRSTGKNTSELNSGFTPDRIRELITRAELAYHNQQYDLLAEFTEEAELLMNSGSGGNYFPLLRADLYLVNMKSASIEADVERLENFFERSLISIVSVAEGLGGSTLGLSWGDKNNQLLEHYIAGLYAIYKETNNQVLLERMLVAIERFEGNNFRIARRAALERAPKESKTSTPFLNQALEFERKAMAAGTQSAREELLKQYRLNLDLYESSLVFPESNHRHSALEHNFVLSDIQAALPQGEIYLRYFVRDSISLLFSLTNNELKVFSLPSKSRLQVYIAKTLEQLSLPSTKTSEHVTNFVPLLLPSKGIEAANKVIVSVDAPLHSLPFPYLLTFTDGELDSNRRVVNVPSIMDYYDSGVTSKNRNVSKVDMFVFADPVFSAEPGVVSSSKRVWREGLGRLPWSAKEAESIVSIFPNKNVTTALREYATTAALLSQNAREARLLHVASHGYFSESNPGIVGIATAADEEFREGFLTLTRLKSQRYSANLVVVSGCETQLGESFYGEGMNGLSRGLMSVGAGSVLATLWSIPDRPTALFMKRFYEELKANNDSAIALANTQSAFRAHKRFSHPFFWAAFVLTSSHHSIDTRVF